MNVQVIPVVMGALGIPSRKLKKHLRKIGIETKIADLKKKNWHHLLCEDSQKA